MRLSWHRLVLPRRNSCGFFLAFLITITVTFALVIFWKASPGKAQIAIHHGSNRVAALRQHHVEKDHGKMELLELGPQRLVHLDLKGAPPKLPYLKQLFPLLKEWGATGLLIEWEDTFPYDGEYLQAIGSSGPDSPGIYSKAQVTEILGLAEEQGLDVIPLVQTFGHLEFVLKHDKFWSLREVEHFPGSMCPSNPESLPLVQAMLEQVVKMHPDIKMLHIGADEVWHMGVCNACRSRMATLGESAKEKLFLDHVTKVLRWMKEKYPYIDLLMWDDMLRHIDPLLLIEYEIGKLVQPMVWHYRNSKTFQLSRDLWPMYTKVFDGIWVATAFKGATGPNVQLPMISMHLDCQERWLQELQIQHDRGTLPKIQGIALTGWSRFDHYAVMCELLPAGLPSLALCLAQWQARLFTYEMHRNISKNLGYVDGQLIPLNPYPPQAANKLPASNFPGWEVRHGIEWFVHLQAKIKSVTDGDTAQTWLHQYFLKINFTNPKRILGLRRKAKQLLDEIAALESYLKPALENIFTAMTIDEWFGTHLEPHREQLKQLLQSAEHQLAVGGRTRNTKINLEL
ncbi:hexosaminidase D-like isoform X2 [Neocloeon triangulifer]|uniref:hexosaminidase D-like isoform X2 n=1 Tax=Neocloeon triangulifer TaxID=2078957 RepID=UPI00286F3956|nr:hexosaminidase D-like isoform X2 [Neocloeon triangulifer]